MNDGSARRGWGAVSAELSPVAVGLAGLLGSWAVASWIPDGRVADRMDYACWGAKAFGLCACGIGWSMAHRPVLAVGLFLARSSLIVSGVWLLDLGLTPLCD